MNSLVIILLYLLSAVLGVAVCRLFKLPAMLGYLAVGVIIGPNALALSGNPEALHSLGEFGVVFLMFVIGLEFNIDTLKTMRKHVLGLGGLQMTVTMLLVTLGLMLLSVWLPKEWQLHWTDALILSGTLAMSSTAIVIKLTAERGELETEHGRRVVGILLFQDLAVVPLMILASAFRSDTSQIGSILTFAFIKAVVVIFVLLVAGRPIMRWWLTTVARRKSEELFVLNLLLVTLGLAWLTELAGLSLALGAFIAGMLISETEFKHSVESDIKPFHDVLLGIFFISIGMMLDWHSGLAHWPLVLFLLVVPLLFKFAVIAVLAKILGSSPGVAIRTGLYLAQAGEFGFVLLAITQQNDLLPPNLLNPILVSMVLSMMITPFIIIHCEKIVLRFSRNEWLHQSVHLTTIAQTTLSCNEHVIILGFGRCGQNLARLLEDQKIPYFALDLDPDRIEQAKRAGQSVIYGDATRTNVLQAAGLSRARCVAITYGDENSGMRVLHIIRQHMPNMSVIIRTQDDRNSDALRAAGATEVVPELLEGSLMLASHVLTLMGVPMRRVVRLVQDQRAARYDLLRSYFHGVGDDESPEEHDQERLISLTIPNGSALLGALYREIQLERVSIIGVRRENGDRVDPDSIEPIKIGDAIVLSGVLVDLTTAQHKLTD
jgi:monovalent cation:H+ antiporter-2, CPA2 family